MVVNITKLINAIILVEERRKKKSISVKAKEVCNRCKHFFMIMLLMKLAK